jgi:hypothetical protein
VIPLFACLVIESSTLEKLPVNGLRCTSLSMSHAAIQAFAKRFQWFLDNKPALAQRLTVLETPSGHARYMLAIPSREQLQRVLTRVLNEDGARGVTSSTHESH